MLDLGYAEMCWRNIGAPLLFGGGRLLEFGEGAFGGGS